MAKKNINQIDTILIQLEAMCTLPNHKNRIQKIKNEVILYREFKGNKQKNSDLYSTLHLTRCMDSSLRLFLDINIILYIKPTMGEYLKKLVNHKNVQLKKLNENLRKRFQHEIVDQRNIYMHSSGAFPNKAELNNLENSIFCCLQTVLNLKN